MAYEFTVFQQDLRAAVMALKEEDLRSLNLYSNRIMANAIFGNDRRLFLPGFFLKDLCPILGFLKERAATSALSTAKAQSNAYAERLLEQTNRPDFNEEQLWKSYHETRGIVIRFTMDATEEKAYGQLNPSFTHEAFRWLISYLDERKDILLHPRNLLLKGILNEMGRIYRSHGAQISETYSMALVTALDWCDEYVMTTSRSDSECEERVKKEILPYVERVVTLLREHPSSSDMVNELLWDLVKKWRLYFIEYMERGRVEMEAIPKPEKGIELPEETRKKLTEAITKSLEK
jgi:hypothetical protein